MTDETDEMLTGRRWCAYKHPAYAGPDGHDYWRCPGEALPGSDYCEVCTRLGRDKEDQS